MSVNGVSTCNANPVSMSRSTEERRTAFSALRESLAAGDLAGAQTAYEAFQSGKQGPNGANPLAKQAETLGVALKSGDLTKAQGVFASLVQNLKGSQATDAGAPARTTTNGDVDKAASRVDVTA